MSSLWCRFLFLALTSAAAFAPNGNAPVNVNNANTNNLNTAGNTSSSESYARRIVGTPISHTPTCTALAMGASSDQEDTGDDTTSTRTETKTLLENALNADADAATKILDAISSFRQNSAQVEMTAFLDNILDMVDGGKKPIWTRLRITSKISRRSRLSALSRLLDISTPEAGDNEVDTDTEEAKKGRRRRALVVALRSLVVSVSVSVSEPSAETETENENEVAPTRKGASIYSIEKAARKDLKEALSSQDMESRLPPGLETPKYIVTVKRAKFEIREYEAFTVCSVPMAKPRPDATATDQKISQPQLSGASSFGALAGYLFGKNQQETAMKMTTPVFTTGDGDGKEMAFVLPSTYWDEDSLSKAPSPLENSLVKLKREIGGQRAVVMFGGLATSKEVELRKQQLMTSLKADKEWGAVENATVTVAQYNDPFTPPWKRLNEVSVPVQNKN